MILPFPKLSMLFRGKFPVAATLLMVPILLQAAVAGECEDRDDVPHLSYSKGLLVLDMVVKRPVSSLEFKKVKSSRRSIKLGAFGVGRVLKAVEVNRGEYQWSEIELPYYDLPFRRVVADDKRWRFHIKPGAVNYVGQIIVGEHRGTDYVDVRLVNRIATEYPEIQQTLKPDLDCYPLVYSGAGRDDFLKEYTQLLTGDNNNDVE